MLEEMESKSQESWGAFRRPSTHCVRKPKAPLDSVRPGGGAGAPEEGIPSGLGGARARSDAPEPRTAWRQEGSGLSTRAARREAPLPRAAGDREDARGASDKREAREHRRRGFRRGWGVPGPALTPRSHAPRGVGREAALAPVRPGGRLRFREASDKREAPPRRGIFEPEPREARR